MLEFTLKKCRNIIISTQKYAFKRCNKKLELIERQGIKIIIREKLGRSKLKRE
ncbi:MAG: hypothetical protein QW412_03045 [Candidatus Aenigmatarchaeota archaeon]